MPQSFSSFLAESNPETAVHVARNYHEIMKPNTTRALKDGKSVLKIEVEAPKNAGYSEYVRDSAKHHNLNVYSQRVRSGILRHTYHTTVHGPADRVGAWHAQFIRDAGKFNHK